MKVFDFHTHLMGVETDDESLLSFAIKRNMGFGISCLGPDGVMLPNPNKEQICRANNMVLDLMNRQPNLVFGFCYVNPLHEEGFIRDEIRRCKDNGMLGLKLWIAARCSNPCVFPAVEEAISQGMPILQHAWIRLETRIEGESDPWDVAALARRYPEAKIVMAHMAHDCRNGVNVIKDYPNVLVDTCGVDSEFGNVEYAVAELGADRVVYGSDAPGRDVLIQIGKVAASDLSDDEKDTVLYGNSARLLGLSNGGIK